MQTSSAPPSKQYWNIEYEKLVLLFSVISNYSNGLHRPGLAYREEDRQRVSAIVRRVELSPTLARLGLHHAHAGVRIEEGPP